MADWSKPDLLSTESEYTDEIKARDEDLAKQFDGTTSTNLPDGTIRWNSVNKFWEKLVAGVWGALCDVYNIVVSRAQQADNADQVDGYDAGTGANQVLVLDANGLVPLANIPTTLTGKDADTVDGYDAGTGANQVLVLDANGLVPLANIPSALTGKDADTVDGAHATATPTPGAIPIADSTGKLATGWIPDTIPTGTRMLFGSPPPPGWVLVTDFHDRVLRIVNDATLVGLTGGDWVITGLSASTTVAGHALTIDEIPPHSHQYYKLSVTYDSTSGGDPIYRGPVLTNTTTVGGGLPHSHGASTSVTHDGSWRPAYLNIVMAEKA